MRILPVASVLALSTVIAAPSARAQEEEPGVTTATWKEPDAPLDLHWHVLALPEYAVELLFSPVGIIVGTVERYRLDERIYDLLRNDAGTIVFKPKLKVALGDGFGFGGDLEFEQMWGGEEEFEVGGLIRVDGDYELSSEYTQSIAAAEGRVVQLRADYEVDKNLPFYGIGNDSGDVEHAMREDALEAFVGFDLIGAGVLVVGGQAQFGVRRSKLSNGADATAPGVADMDSTVELPPDFGVTVTYPWFATTLRFDRRDNIGRPSRGFVAQIRAMYTQAIGDHALSAMTGELELWGFVPLLPDRRVLALGFGLGGATSARGNDDVPTHALVTLGRKSHLRGCDRSRFRDELGWWATAEYRWPIWEYIDTGVALSPMLFVDVGRVSPDLEGIFDSSIRYSGGVGIRGAHDVVEILRAQVGVSPEGIEIDFGIGGDL